MECKNERKNLTKENNHGTRAEKLKTPQQKIASFQNRDAIFSEFNPIS